jgi:hypothetical protein
MNKKNLFIKRNRFRNSVMYLLWHGLALPSIVMNKKKKKTHVTVTQPLESLSSLSSYKDADWIITRPLKERLQFEN